MDSSKPRPLSWGRHEYGSTQIGPGPIDNRMIQSLESQYSPEDPGAVRDDLTGKIALGRYGTNEEVAKLALFLASDESSYCSGGIYMIDGGFTAT